MENTLNSSINKSLISCHKETNDHSLDEESGWTAYFEDLDFSNNNNIDDHHHVSSYSSCSSFSNPSLISDAGSCIAWKVSHNTPSLPKKINFKESKSRTKEISHDDSLEDTASSPVNSPKVSALNQITMKPRKADFNMGNSLGKGNLSECNHSSKLQGNEMKKYELTDLKKRGLCLVPMSMLVNYFC